MVRSELRRTSLWRQVFAKFTPGHNLPTAVELVHPGGRCNFTYRVQAGDQRYVVRYHDPLGRDFLQRYSPATAVRIYLGAEELFTICLGRSSVIETLYPDLRSLEQTGTASEAKTNVAEIVMDRILVQRDYSDQFFVLADYKSERPELSRGALIDLFCRPLAVLHAQSGRLEVRASRPDDADTLAKAYRRYLPWRRFPSNVQYGKWLRGPNWITRATLAAFSGELNSSSLHWRAILAYLKLNPPEFVVFCRSLWLASQQAMRIGSLAHFDHNPRNCFVDRKTATRACIFDFDYISTADPAYDFGISLHALLRLLKVVEMPEPTSEALSIASEFSKAYACYYLKFATRPMSPDGILRRGRKFAALALAVTFEATGTTAARAAPLDVASTCAALLTDR